jgi:type II secretory pathway component PulF
MDLILSEIMNYVAQFKKIIKRWQFSTKAQLVFLEDLYLLINDGIPANRAIELMSQVTTGLTREVSLSLGEKIAQGQPLAEGMKEWFAMNVVEIIRVGETGGALATTMKSAINTLAQKGVAISSFVAAVSYPLLVIAMSCIVVVYLDSAVFNQFRMIKPEKEWPMAGQRLVFLSHFIESWWWIVILAVIGIVIGLRRLMSSYVGELRPVLDGFPPFSFYRRLTAGRLLETLGLLVSNGVVFKSAIKIMQYQANPYLLSHLTSMEHLLSMGKTNIADVLATGLLDRKDLMRLRVMAEVKGFEHGLIRMGVRGTQEATDTLKLISKIVGGVLLAAGGLMVIIIIQGVYLTGMSMGSQ